MERRRSVQRSSLGDILEIRSSDAQRFGKKTIKSSQNYRDLLYRKSSSKESTIRFPLPSSLRPSESRPIPRLVPQSNPFFHCLRL